MALSWPSTQSSKQGPARSARAVQAHAAGEVRWIVDVAQATLVRVDRPAMRRRRLVTVLAAAATAVWVLDLGMVVTNLH